MNNESKLLKVFDGIIPQELADTIEHIFLEDCIVPFKYIDNVALPDTGVESPGFASVFFPFEHSFLEKEDKIYGLLKHLMTEFSRKTETEVDNVLAFRSFIHLPRGESKKDHIHTDLPVDHFVMLYYINDSEGNTVLFQDDEETIIREVSPKKGRIVFFDGSIKHCSTTPSKKTRAVINVNFTSNSTRNE